MQLRNCRVGEEMPEKKVEEKEEKQYPITIPDWITYLTSMFSNAMSLSVVIVSIFAVMVLAFIGFYSPGIFGFFPTLSLMAVAGILFYFLLDNVERRSSKYQKLLKKIMKGEIPKSEEILKEYRKIEKNGGEESMVKSKSKGNGIFSKKDEYIVVFSVLFGIFLGIIGNFWVTLFFKVIDIVHAFTPAFYVMYFILSSIALVVLSCFFIHKLKILEKEISK